MKIRISLAKLEEIHSTYKDKKSMYSTNSAVEPLLASIKLAFIQHRSKTAESHDSGFIIINTKDHHRQVTFEGYFKSASPTGSATDTLVFELLCGGNQYIQEYFTALGLRDAKSVWNYINSNQTKKYQALYSTGFFDELDDLDRLKDKTFKASTIKLFIEEADFYLCWANEIIDIIKPNEHDSKILRAKLLATLALTPSKHQERKKLYEALGGIKSSETADEYKDRVFSAIKRKTGLPIVTISKEHLLKLTEQFSTLSTRISDSTPDLSREVLLELMSQLSVIVRQLENTTDETQIILPNSIVTHCEKLLKRPNNGNPNIDVLFFAYALISDNGTETNIADKYKVLEKSYYPAVFAENLLGKFQTIPKYTEENLRAIFSITNTTLRTQFFVSLEKLRSMNCWRNYDVYKEKLNRPFHQINKACLERLKSNNTTANTVNIVMIILATVNGLEKIQKFKFKKAEPYLDILITKNPLLDLERNLATIIEALKLMQPNAPVSHMLTLENQEETIFLRNFYLNIYELESIFDNEEQALTQQQTEKLHKALYKFNQLTLYKKENCLDLGLSQKQDQETNKEISKHMPSITAILNTLATCRKSFFHKIEQDITFKLLVIALSPAAEKYFSDDNISRMTDIISDQTYRECDLLKAMDQTSELPGITINKKTLQAIYHKYADAITSGFLGEKKASEAIRPIFDRVKNAVKSNQPLFINPMLYFSLDFEPGLKTLAHSTDNRAAAQIDFLLEILCEGNTEHAQKLKFAFKSEKISHRIYVQIFSDPNKKEIFFQGIDLDKKQANGLSNKRSSNQHFSRHDQESRVTQCKASFAYRKETGSTEEKPEKTLRQLGVTTKEMSMQVTNIGYGL